MVQRFAATSSYQTIIHGLLEMYHLARQGKFESPEADAVRDAMDAPWELLTESERERARELSKELNAILESYAQDPKGSS